MAGDFDRRVAMRGMSVMRAVAYVHSGKGEDRAFADLGIGTGLQVKKHDFNRHIKACKVRFQGSAMPPEKSDAHDTQ